MNPALTFDDIILIPLYNEIESRKDVCTKVICKTHPFFLDLPIFSANMDTITESSMANYIVAKGGMGVLHRFMSIERNIEEFKKSHIETFVSVGTSLNEYNRLAQLYNAGAKNFCIDVAHGHSKATKDMIRYIKDNLKDTVVIAGNVCTYDGARFLEDAGADLVKVGIGPGSVCSTRVKTGFGYPQLEAISECSKVGVSIIADGGIRTPGDIVKALGFGADFVMLGGMLAGTEHTPGETFVDLTTEVPRQQFKVYRGMASKEAADDFLGGLTEWKTAEGISTTVPWKDTNNVFHDIIGGLRSGLTYCGAKNIRELQDKIEYVTISQSGLIEGKPHKIL